MLKEMNLYNQIAFILVLVGGICWGLVGLFDVYVISAILGNLLGRIIYLAVGVAAGWLIYQIYLEKMKKPVV